MVEKQCHKCLGTDVVLDYKCGDVVCRLCGEVSAGRYIDPSAEWNNYAEDDRERGDCVARAETSDNSFHESPTTSMGGPEGAASSLNETQYMLENRLHLKALKTVDTVAILGEKLRMSPSIQVGLVSHVLLRHYCVIIIPLSFLYYSFIILILFLYLLIFSFS